MSDGVRGEVGGAPHRTFGVLSGAALNLNMIVGTGIFGAIPYMLAQAPGVNAVLAWLAAGALMVVDRLVWSELGAAMPGSGGTYVYLLESYGRERWGRLMAFLFISTFLLSGPLEIASGLILIAQFSGALSRWWREFDLSHTCEVGGAGHLALVLGPARVLSCACAILIVVLLYRRGRAASVLTVALVLGVLISIAWVLVEAMFYPGSAPVDAGRASMAQVGAAMPFAVYACLGYYSVCFVADEVIEPSRTIPRAILVTAFLVTALYLALHFALTGIVSTFPTDLDHYNLGAAFMEQVRGGAAGRIMTCLLTWNAIASAYAGTLTYSRIPYGAAKAGHFFEVFSKVHGSHYIPHVSLLFVGGLVSGLVFFDLNTVIGALVVTRITKQFIAQVVAVILNRRRMSKALPFRMWLYPLPCVAALAGWTFVYMSSGARFIAYDVALTAIAVAAFLLWAKVTHRWPFAVGP